MLKENTITKLIKIEKKYYNKKNRKELNNMLWEGVSIDNFNKSKQYLGDFKLTPYLSFLYNNDINRGFETLAIQSQELIDSYLNYSIHRFTFNTLLPIQKELLIKALFYQITHILYNVLPIERTEDQAVSIPNSTSITLQLKQYIYGTDALSTRTKDLCEATGLRYDDLHKEKYIDSRITYLPDINSTYKIDDLKKLDCNFYYFVPNINGVPNLSLLNIKVNNSISAFLQKINDEAYKLLILYYIDNVKKIEGITETILYINLDKNPKNIGDDGAKWININNTNTKYYGDMDSIIIDNNNIIKSIGVHYTDNKKNEDGILSGTDINNNFSTLTNNYNTLNDEVDKNATEITTINKKIINIVDKTKLNEIISIDKENNLILGEDKKLFVKNSGGGGGNTYYGDKTSIQLDSSNTFSAWGIHYTENDVLGGTEIKNNLDNIDRNYKKLDTTVNQNKTDIGKNKTDIGQNKTDINTRLKYEEIDESSIVKASSSKKYYCYALSKPDAQQYWNIDDINKIIDNKIKDAISKIVIPKWKIALTPDKFILKDTGEVVFNYELKQNSIYYFFASGIPDLTTLIPIAFVSPPIIFSSLVKAIILHCFYAFDLLNNTYSILITASNNEGSLNLIKGKEGIVAITKKPPFYLFELENAIEPVPVPPSIIFSESNEYDYFKKYLKVKKYLKGDNE